MPDSRASESFRLANDVGHVVRIVPRSQVWAGSRGRASSRLHLRLDRPFVWGARFRRDAGQFLCGRQRGWYEDDDARSFEGAQRCARCAELVERYEALTWPENQVIA